MAKKEGGGAPDNVVAIGAGTCCFEKCTKKSDKMNFCPEHYMWFKEGLINRKGVKPTDFDKKFHDYALRKKAA